MKRNDSEYDFAGAITSTESEEIIQVVQQFAVDAEAWIAGHDPSLA
jgi:hypothetical protein